MALFPLPSFAVETFLRRQKQDWEIPLGKMVTSGLGNPLKENFLCIKLELYTIKIQIFNLPEQIKVSLTRLFVASHSNIAP